MFTTEQNIAKNTSKQLKKAVLENGMRLAGKPIVKTNFTYKEVTIAVGVIVACLVIFLLSVTTSSAGIQASSLVPSFNIPSPNIKNITEAFVSFIF